MNLTYGRVNRLEAVAGILDFFVYAEQTWCTWEKLEESIAKVDYEKMPDDELGWFIEFMMNACFRVWRSTKEDPSLNKVKEEEDCFFIDNYDWSAFKFSRKKGTDKDTTVYKSLCLDKTKLSEQEIKWLRGKCK